MATVYSLAGKRVYVAGHAGMVGSALVRRLAGEQCTMVTASRAEVDLRDQAAVFEWLTRVRPSVLIAWSSPPRLWVGFSANSTRPAEFLYDNLAIGANLIEAARRAEVEKLLYLGQPVSTLAWRRNRCPRTCC